MVYIAVLGTTNSCGSIRARRSDGPMNNSLLFLTCVGWPFIAQAQTSQSVAAVPEPTHQTYLRLAAEVTDTLHSDVLDVWFPRSVDTKFGGFHSHFGRDWRELPSDGKFSVFQGRMTWVAAQVVMREPAMKDEFVPIVRHGVDFLINVMWDKQDGGFSGAWTTKEKSPRHSATKRNSTASASVSTEPPQRTRRQEIRRRSRSRRTDFSGPTSMRTTLFMAGISNGSRAMERP